MNRKGRKEMAIFITGDTHGDFSRLQPAAFREQHDLTKEDYLIICGDFGGVWDGSDTEQRWAGLAGGQALYHTVRKRES